MFGFSKETSHLDGSFEYPEEIQMILFSKFANLPSLEPNKKPIKSRLFVNPDARFLVLDTCSSLRWSCFLII